MMDTSALSHLPTPGELPAAALDHALGQLDPLGGIATKLRHACAVLDALTGITPATPEEWRDYRETLANLRVALGAGATAVTAVSTILATVLVSHNVVVRDRNQWRLAHGTLETGVKADFFVDTGAYYRWLMRQGIPDPLTPGHDPR